MGTHTVYLLPKVSDVSPAKYRSLVKSTLLRMGVIDDVRYDDIEPGWYCAGENSLAPFEEGHDLETGFEYCIIRGSKNLTVVPQDPSPEPKCPSCSADVSEQYYDTINDVEDLGDNREKSQAYVAARISCPVCRHESRLTELKDHVGIFLSGTWVNFEDIPAGLKPEWLAEFNKRCGIEHDALTYWYT